MSLHYLNVGFVRSAHVNVNYAHITPSFASSKKATS